jgi:hypothetical protein
MLLDPSIELLGQLRGAVTGQQRLDAIAGVVLFIGRVNHFNERDLALATRLTNGGG